MAHRKITIQCPGCQSELVIDVTTGQILHHKLPKEAAAGGKDFETLLSDLDVSKSRADEIFDREFSALKDRDRLMEEKFQEALRRAEEDDDDEPPVRPWDLD